SRMTATRRPCNCLAIPPIQLQPTRSAMSRRRFLKLMAGVPGGIAAPSLLRAESATIKVATGVTPPSIHNIYIHVAYERGMFRDNGIKVADFIQLRGGPLANQ